MATTNAAIARARTGTAASSTTTGTIVSGKSRCELTASTDETNASSAALMIDCCPCGPCAALQIRSAAAHDSGTTIASINWGRVAGCTCIHKIRCTDSTSRVAHTDHRATRANSHTASTAAAMSDACTTETPHNPNARRAAS